MTETGDPELPEPAEQEYFRAIEDLFIALRGAPLLLSPTDWQVAREWHRQGVPLELVGRVLEEVFEKRRERAARGRVNSLRYCAPAVEKAWAELRELQVPAASPRSEEPAVEERLEGLAAALPAGLPGREAWAGRLLGLEGSPREVEAALATLDLELLAATRESLADAELRQLEEKTASALGALSRRLSEGELEAVRRQLERQLLRRHAGLPVLTLFGAGPAPDSS